MHEKRKRRLLGLTALILLLGVVSALVLFAMRQNISLFYTPTQVSEGKAPLNHSIRVGGMVVKDSVHYLDKGHVVTFKVTDYHATVSVNYKGLLPDLFREGQGIVVTGRLENKEVVVADEVLAKHDATYMPPELRALAQTQTQRS